MKLSHFSSAKRIVFSFICFLSALMLVGQVQVGQDINGEASGDHLGNSVSLSENGMRIAIGVPLSNSRTGHVRVYELLGNQWSQLGQDIDGEDFDNSFGYSVSLSSDGTRVAIGAPRNDDGGDFAGHVRIYELLDGQWSQLGQDIDGEETRDESGFSVSLSSDGIRVAIGAPRNNDGGDFAGHVRIYELLDNQWFQLGQDIDGEAIRDGSGSSVSLSANGMRVAIGAIDNDDAGFASGHVRVYEFVDGQWIQFGDDIDGEATGDESGTSVSLSSTGTRVAIGALRNDDGGDAAGQVRIYDFMNGSWIQLGEDIDGEASGDLSGVSVSLSSSGDRVAIGATGNDDNGDNAGQVRIYDFSGNQWVQVGVDIDGEFELDVSGRSVSLSADGVVVAIGAIFNGDGGFGQVRIYEASSVTSSIEPHSQSYDIKVWPNPISGGQLRLTYSCKSRNSVELSIFNITGSLIKKIELTERAACDVYHLVVDDLSSGVYIIRYSQNGQNQYVRFVKRK